MPVPADRRYRATHQWAKRLPDGICEIGITDFAQSELGDLMFAMLPEPGTPVSEGKPCATLESVKTASDVTSPITGIITSVNERVRQNPEILNQSPYDHWIVCVRPEQDQSFLELLSAEAYQKLL